MADIRVPDVALLKRVTGLIDRRSDDQCWPWLGNIAVTGYGRLSIHNRLKLAHRVVYELFAGPIPEGLTIDHLCREARQ